MIDTEVLKSMMLDDNTIIALVHNHHCEHYELQIDGIPVFNCKDYTQAEYEYSMEAA